MSRHHTAESWLADLGAETIKIESPRHGDSSRNYGPFKSDAPDAERSLLFAYLNCNKKGITLDVASSFGRSVLLQLAKRSDILIENNAPSFLVNLGLDYAALSEANPGLIVTSITPFGQTGPYRDYKATDLVSIHGSGTGFYSPWDVQDLDQPPLKPPGNTGHFVAGVAGACATMLAVFARRSTGEGQHVDVSEQEALAALMRMEISRYLGRGISPTRLAAADLWGGMRRPLQCKDGYFSMQPFGAVRWARMRQIMGDPEWAPKELSENFSEGLAALAPLIEDWAIQYTREELYQMIQVEGGIPCLPVNTISELFADDHLKKRGSWVEMQHPIIGGFTAPGPAHHFSDTPASYRHPAPMLGQHNQEILGDLLGYSNDDLTTMARLRVI